MNMMDSFPLAIKSELQVEFFAADNPFDFWSYILRGLSEFLVLLNRYVLYRFYFSNLILEISTFNPFILSLSILVQTPLRILSLMIYRFNYQMDFCSQFMVASFEVHCYSKFAHFQVYQSSAFLDLRQDLQQCLQFSFQLSFLKIQFLIVWKSLREMVVSSVCYALWINSLMLSIVLSALDENSIKKLLNYVIFRCTQLRPLLATDMNYSGLYQSVKWSSGGSLIFLLDLLVTVKFKLTSSLGCSQCDITESSPNIFQIAYLHDEGQYSFSIDLNLFRRYLPIINYQSDYSLIYIQSYHLKYRKQNHNIRIQEQQRQYTMGSAFMNQKHQPVLHANQNQNIKQDKVTKKKDKDFDIDVIEVSNIALAIKHKQHTVNVQLSISCKNLPKINTFQEVNSMVIVYKIQNKSNKTEDSQKVQIGRTQIVKNELNPKYIDSFVFSFNSQKHQQIVFQIYNIQKSKFGQQSSKLIGVAQQRLEVLVESQFNELIVQSSISDKKEKIILKANCIEYDGGNSTYEVVLEATNFVGKLDIYYVIEVWKDSEWMPIIKSKNIEIKKKLQFQSLTIPSVKFAGEQNARIRIKIQGRTKQDEQYEQIGSTDQITMINIMADDKQPQRVYKNGFVIGNIVINKWRKVSRDSFISYIVNGARLHLILGIDYTNSNEQGASLHNVQNGSNAYIQAIKQIVGVLQYFDYYNQIALYGFGAKLPPYYKSVGQCFALNGNFFNPTVIGGVDQIIKYYLKNLKSVEKHGPSELSQIIDIAIQFAKSQYQSTNYYVLILLTDGQINDYPDTVDKVIQASSLPLSIILVGLGDKDFTLIKKLDQQNQNQPLKSFKTNEVCSRDMVDFINFNEFICGDKSMITQTNLARKTFSQIPSQFIDYMARKNIKPNKQKKALKAAKAEFITEKIKEHKRNSSQIPIVVTPQFLQSRKKKMKKELIALGFDPQDELMQNLKIAMDDLSYFIEIHSSLKKNEHIQQDDQVQYVNIREEKKFEQFLEKKQQLRNKKIQEELEKRQTNQYGRKIKQIEKKEDFIKAAPKYLNHPCLKCKENQINILHYECGHASVCSKCKENRCFLCGHKNKQLITIED